MFGLFSLYYYFYHFFFISFILFFSSEHFIDCFYALPKKRKGFTPGKANIKSSFTVPQKFDFFVFLSLSDIKRNAAFHVKSFKTIFRFIYIFLG